MTHAKFRASFEYYNESFNALREYISEKRQLGLISSIKLTLTRKHIIVHLLGVRQKIWERVLEPEFRRLAPVQEVQVHAGCIDVHLVKSGE